MKNAGAGNEGWQCTRARRWEDGGQGSPSDYPYCFLVLRRGFPPGIETTGLGPDNLLSRKEVLVTLRHPEDGVSILASIMPCPYSCGLVCKLEWKRNLYRKTHADRRIGVCDYPARTSYTIRGCPTHQPRVWGRVFMHLESIILRLQIGFYLSNGTSFVPSTLGARLSFIF